MATIIDTLVTKVEFDTDTSGLKKANSSISDFAKSAGALLAPVIALFAGGSFITSTADAADEMLKFANSTGVAVDALQDLEFAAQRQGGTVDGLRNSIQSLSEKLGEAAALGTGEAVPVLEALGLSAKNADGSVKGATKVMFELNKAFQTLSKAEQISFSKKLGIDAGTLRLLQSAPRELENLISQSKNFGRVTEEELKAAADFNDALTNLTTAFGRMASKIGLAVMPAITGFIDGMMDVVNFVKENSQFFTIFAGVIAALGAAFIALTVGLVPAAVAMWAFLAPILLIIGVALAAGLAIFTTVAAIDDLIMAFTGGRSVIRDFFLEFFEFDIVQVVDDIGKAFVGLWTGVKNLFSVEFWTGVWGNMKIAFDLIISQIKDTLKNAIADATGGVTGFFDSALDIVGLGSNDAPIGTNGTTTNNSRNTSIGNVTVNIEAKGASANDIAVTAGAAFKNELRNAAQNFDSGIKR